jgi:hypothetical protein
MAKFHSLLDAINGGKGLSGTIGDRVYYQRNGISYSRSKPVSMKNPGTPAQLAQRTKLAVILKFLQPIKEFVRIGFQSKAKHMSAFNYATSFLYKNALTGDNPDFSIDYSSVLLSAGNLGNSFEPKIALITAFEIEFTWSIDMDVYNYFLNDKAMLLAYNLTKQEAIIITDGNNRISLCQVIKLPETYAGDEIVCYMAFRDLDGKKVSYSQYLGRIRIGERRQEKGERRTENGE